MKIRWNLGEGKSYRFFRIGNRSYSYSLWSYVFKSIKQPINIFFHTFEHHSDRTMPEISPNFTLSKKIIKEFPAKE